MKEGPVRNPISYSTETTSWLVIFDLVKDVDCVIAIALFSHSVMREHTKWRLTWKLGKMGSGSEAPSGCVLGFKWIY